MSTVSVIIPTYCHREFVGDTLTSVFAQSFTDYEIIVVNDGSPDDTAHMLRPHVQSGRIKYIEQPNRGQAAARNRGLEFACGDFVAFLDDDDLWPSDKLGWQVAELRSSPNLVLVGGSVRLIDAKGLGDHDLILDNNDVGRENILRGCPFHSPGQTLIRRSALDAVGGFDASVWGADDYDLYLKLACVGPIRTSGRISLNYRVHAGNASKQKMRMLQNTMAVLRRHVTGLSSAASRPAYRWLYEYSGREFALEARRAILSANRLAAVRNIRALSHFVRPALRDPRLAWQLAGDLIPTRVGDRWRSSFGRRLAPTYFGER